MATASSPALRLPSEPQSGALLGVEHSIRGRRWTERLDTGGLDLAARMAQAHGIPEIVARILAGRGIAGPDAERFLDPTIRDLMPDPSSLRDMEKGAERCARAIRDREPVAVLGDYDVDGAASAALISRFMQAHGQPARVYIPDRLTEGYGANPEAMQRLADEGARLILTVDCGATSSEAIAAANVAGAEVIVLDHHPPGETLPAAVAVIDPNRHDDLSGQGHLAAAGVVFLFLVATARALRDGGGDHPAPDLLAWLDLVALATICDLVPLKGLNRAFVKQGLKVMRHRQNVGLRALLDRAGLKEAPHAGTLGFILGPRINAGGRIGECGLGANLLATDDEAEATRIAESLERLNAERRAIELRICEEAVARAEAALGARPDAPLLAVAADGWHPGVLGLVASRLVDRFGLPAIVLGWSGNEGTGSARSIAGADIGLAIREAAAQGLLRKGGGHAMAGGLSVDRARFPAAVAHIEQALQKRRIGQAPSPRALVLDGLLAISAMTPDLLANLDRIGPFGPGHPEPGFALADVRPTAGQVVGGEHVRCTLVDARGGRIEAIAFRAAEAPLGRRLLAPGGRPLHVSGRPKQESWQGSSRIRLVLDDVAEPGGAPCDGV